MHFGKNGHSSISLLSSLLPSWYPHFSSLHLQVLCILVCVYLFFFLCGSVWKGSLDFCAISLTCPLLCGSTHDPLGLSSFLLLSLVSHILLWFSLWVPLSLLTVPTCSQHTDRSSCESLAQSFYHFSQVEPCSNCYPPLASEVSSPILLIVGRIVLHSKDCSKEASAWGFMSLLWGVLCLHVCCLSMLPVLPALWPAAPKPSSPGRVCALGSCISQEPRWCGGSRHVLHPSNTSSSGVWSWAVPPQCSSRDRTFCSSPHASLASGLLAYFLESSTVLTMIKRLPFPPLADTGRLGILRAGGAGGYLSLAGIRLTLSFQWSGLAGGEGSRCNTASMILLPLPESGGAV